MNQETPGSEPVDSSPSAAMAAREDTNGTAAALPRHSAATQGGSYSREDIRDIVAGAASRFPGRQERTELVLLEVDPHRLHAYWSIDRQTLNEALKALGPAGPQGPMILRFQEIDAAGAATESFDVPVHGFKNAWYVDIWRDGRTYRAALGMRAADGTMVWLTRSNRATVPPAGPSSDTALDLVTVEQMPTTRSYFPELQQRRPPPQGDGLFAALYPGVPATPASPEEADAAAGPIVAARSAGQALGLDRAIEGVEAALAGPTGGDHGSLTTIAGLAVGAPQTPHHGAEPAAGRVTPHRPVARLPEHLARSGESGDDAHGVEISPETVHAVAIGGDVAAAATAQGASGIVGGAGGEAPSLVQESLRRVFPNVLEEEDAGAEMPPVWAQTAAREELRGGNGFGAPGDGGHPEPGAGPGPGHPGADWHHPDWGHPTNGAHPAEARGPEGEAAGGQALPLESILNLSSFQFGREDVQLEMNAELHIYGRANPDAKLSLFGQRLRLRPDGSFSIRRPLPHGALVIPLLLNPGVGFGDPGDL